MKKIIIAASLMSILSMSFASKNFSFNTVIKDNTPDNLAFYTQNSVNGAPPSGSEELKLATPSQPYMHSLDAKTFKARAAKTGMQTLQGFLTLTSGTKCQTPVLSGAKMISALNSNDINLVFTIKGAAPYNCTVSITPASIIN